MNMRYMGSKRKLAPVVASILKQLTSGYCVDLFCGMCSVATSLADTNPVIANDVQTSAAFMASTYIATPDGPPNVKRLNGINRYYKANLEALVERFNKDVQEEEFWLREAEIDNWEQYKTWCLSMPHVGQDPDLQKEASLLRVEPGFPYRLFTITFPNSYFGLFQCMQIDSIKYAVDQGMLHGEIDQEEAKWVITALAQALGHVSSSPGHFAAFLQVRDSESFESVRKLRRRDILSQVMVELERIEQPGDSSWRESNVVLNEDALEVIPKLASLGAECVYADPPYTGAQYSRFYHVLETLVLYDYPSSHFRGRYRPDRYMSPFCRVSEVEEAFDKLASSVASLGIPLLISYPSSGILHSTGITPKEILKKYFSSVEVLASEDQYHSTLGASKGYATISVQEFLILAR